MEARTLITQTDYKYITPGAYYPFTALPATFSETEIQWVGGRLRERFGQLAKNWTGENNSHWSARVFYSAKLILSATITVNTLYYSEQHNLRAVFPYLRYYSVLSVMRALVLMLPETVGDLTGLFSMTHSKAINLTCDHISKFNSEFGSELKNRILLLKAQRELISYGAPSSGDQYAGSIEDIAHLCRLLAEVAQFNSEFLEERVVRFSDPKSWTISDEDIGKVATVENEGFVFEDIEDAYRFSYFARKSPRVTNILSSMTEGHTEDFMGAWQAEDERTAQFDPDEDTQIIFDIP